MSQGNLNILQMAEQIANSIPDSEKKEMENMDMEKMLGMLSKNVFSQLQGIDKSGQMDSPPPAPTIVAVGLKTPLNINANASNILSK